MTRTLLLAEHDGSTLKDVSLKAFSAAREASSGEAVDILLFGASAREAALSATSLDGAGKVVMCESPRFEHPLAEDVAVLALGLMRERYDHLFAAASALGKSACPRVAAGLDVMQISDISAIFPDGVYERPIYAGNALQRVRSRDSKTVITVRASSFASAAAEGASDEARIEAIDFSESASSSTYVGEEVVRTDRPELTSARVVVSGGRGMQAGENFAMLEKVADRLGAAVGASRAAVDAGFAPNDRQVGQTGKVVSPELYVAVGISGAIQHLAGMKDSKVIVAINKDEDAPIFQVADYGLVADLFSAVPELDKALERAGY